MSRADARESLGRAYTAFLQDADPRLHERPDLAQELASMLVEFTDVWADNVHGNPQRIEEAAQYLRSLVTRQRQLLSQGQTQEGQWA